MIASSPTASTATVSLCSPCLELSSGTLEDEWNPELLRRGRDQGQVPIFFAKGEALGLRNLSTWGREHWRGPRTRQLSRGASLDHGNAQPLGRRRGLGQVAILDFERRGPRVEHIRVDQPVLLRSLRHDVNKSHNIRWAVASLADARSWAWCRSRPSCLTT